MCDVREREGLAAADTALQHGPPSPTSTPLRRVRTGLPWGRTSQAPYRVALWLPCFTPGATHLTVQQKLFQVRLETCRTLERKLMRRVVHHVRSRMWHSRKRSPLGRTGPPMSHGASELGESGL